MHPLPFITLTQDNLISNGLKLDKLRLSAHFIWVLSYFYLGEKQRGDVPAKTKFYDPVLEKNAENIVATCPGIR